MDRSNSHPSKRLCTGHRSSPIRFDDLDFQKKGYEKWTAYGQSKTANIYLANEIERRYGSKGVYWALNKC